MYFGLLTIKNFFRTKYVEVDLSHQGLTSIVGINHDTGKSNETGKSTIFNALSWCLYGRYPGGPSKSSGDVINPLFPDDLCEVSVEIIGNATKTIKRGVQRQGNKFIPVFDIIENRSNNDVSYSFGNERTRSKPTSIEKFNAFIVYIIEISYETFIRCHYFPQLGIKLLGEMTDKELKEYFITRLLNVEWTVSALDKVKEEEKQTNNNISKLDGMITALKDKGVQYEKDLKRWEEEEDVWKREATKVIQNYELQVKDQQVKRQELLNNRKEVEYQIKELLNKNKGSLILRKKAEEIIKKADAIKNEIDKLEFSIGTNETWTNKILVECENQPAIGLVCDTCGSIVDSEGITRLIVDREKKVLIYETEISKWKNDVEILRLKRTEMLSEAQKEMNYVIALEEKEKEEDAKLESLKGFLKYNTTEEIDDRIDFLKNEIKEAKQKGNPYTKTVNETIQSMKRNQVDMDKISQKIHELESNMNLIKFWKVGFSPKGIQSFLLESITPTINEGIKKYLKYLSDGRIKAYFTTVTRLKSGEYREKFKLNVENRDGGDSYTSLSGGAKQRVNLACSLAISDFQRSITKSSLDLIVLDEVTSFLDSYWEEKFLKMLETYFSTVPCFIISHKNTIKNSLLSRNIVVEKISGITRIKE